MVRTFLAGLMIVLAALGWSGQAAASDAVRLASHRAIYQMTLDRSHAGGGVTSVSGEMAIEWLRACDGWTFEHQSSMAVELAGGDSMQISTTATSWEAFDGRHYRFSMRNTSNGGESERIEGTAVIDRPGGPGKAELTSPKPRRFALPAGTLFPVAHTVEVLRRAMSDHAPTMFPAVVFDGMGDEGPLAATTTIGKERRGDAAPGTPAAALAGKTIWPVTVAYYPVASKSPLPKQEIGMSLYANGVADNLVIGFDNFVVRARIAKLEFVKSPDCSDSSH